MIEPDPIQSEAPARAAAGQPSDATPLAIAIVEHSAGLFIQLEHDGAIITLGPTEVVQLHTELSRRLRARSLTPVPWTNAEETAAMTKPTHCEQ